MHDPRQSMIRPGEAVDAGEQREVLLFVGLNPPLTSGARTRSRVELARALLGFEAVEHGNLFALPTKNSTGLSTLGVSDDGWVSARAQLSQQLRRANGTLLGYGVQGPSGTAGRLFRAQAAWLEAELVLVGLPVWLVGGRPRHPSRWQRYTHRAHPGVPFDVALAAALRRRNLSGLGDC